MSKEQELTAIAEDAMRNNHELLKIAKRYEDDLAAIKKSHADDKAILLEKVASLQGTVKSASLDSSGVANYVAQLVDRNLVDARDMQRVIENIDEDPNRLVKLASTIIELSTGSQTIGAGISKSAFSNSPSLNVSEWEQDGWDQVVSD